MIQFQCLINALTGTDDPPPKTTPQGVGRLAETPTSQHLAARFPKPGYHAAPQKRSAIDRFETVGLWRSDSFTEEQE
jgi:hypothetical protein